MSNIKKIAVKALADYISTRVPELTTSTHVGAQGPEITAKWPSLVLVPGSFSFNPIQADEVYDPEDIDVLVSEVGDFEGVVELQLFAKSGPERNKIEQKIVDLFLSTPWAPGVIKTTTPNLTVGGTATLYPAPVAFRLDGEDWQEEFSFEKRRFSFLDVELNFPALMLQTAYTIDTLKLAITEDLSSDVAAEEVTVNEDGTIS